MKKYIPILAFSLCSNLATAEYQGPGSYGIGSNKCGEYIKAVELSRLGDFRMLNAFLSWRDGFLSAESIRLDRSLGDTGGSEVWLENYCRESPLEIFPIAVIRLMVEMDSKN
jgi:hypothetical protein